LPEIREKKIGSELHWIWKIDPTDANLSVAKLKNNRLQNSRKNGI
jgi:hypothetical protein